MESATCIVALSHEGTVWMGGDAAASGTQDLTILANKKVFQRVDSQQTLWLFGFSGAYRFGQALQYLLDIPPIEKGDDDDLLGFMVRKFIPALQKCLESALFAQKEKERLIGGTCMVCIKGRIFHVGEQYSVQETVSRYNAIGCGAPYALGSLYSTEQFPPEKRIQLALEAAEKFTTAVQGPFTVIHS